ncbi:NAD(P)H-dependent FMN reductase [Pontibacter ummariensis]|uniref:NAD(P)H-dependent FMN reductase n=1 Tax=Pontibacter ummariensis TaxID=1610492 RepID=A0A239KE18_9BACT|nr:NAD(P)H-dependent oxidoreductase [Pontibacter ummariensis]PRY06401.1 NAD(P)H-dependent FMN reductase [Pontibacter ummariensis]SNT16606.1 NAD(P)H-dependent FMN reductase [Pontibacter ummariensis]
MITIIAGTNRPDSNALRVAKYYKRRLQEKGQETNLLSLAELPASLIESDLYGSRSEAFAKVQNLVSGSEKFLFVIPEYNGSFPGVLKTFIDACEFPASFYEKKAALVGVSSGRQGNLRGIDHFTGVANHMHLHIMPLKIYLPSVEAELDDNSNLHKEGTVRFTDEQIEKFMAF